MIDALVSVGAIDSDRDCGFRSSSRTDRGVSALGNIVSFRTKFRLESLCPAVNSAIKSIWAYSALNVEDGFNPRWAMQRWYRYCLPRVSQDERLMKRAATRFIGTHDFSGFARLDGRNPDRTVDAIDISGSDAFYIIDFRAESFLWNMVRRIVWCLDAVGNGSIRLDEFDLDTGLRPRRAGLASPEYLILMDVDCGLNFPLDRRAARALQPELRQRLTGIEMDREMARMMCSLLNPGIPGED